MGVGPHFPSGPNGLFFNFRVGFSPQPNTCRSTPVSVHLQRSYTNSNSNPYEHIKTTFCHPPSPQHVSWLQATGKMKKVGERKGWDALSEFSTVVVLSSSLPSPLPSPILASVISVWSCTAPIFFFFFCVNRLWPLRP